MNKLAIAFLAFVFGWLAGHVQSYIQHQKLTEDERFVLNRVEETMNERKPFRLLGQWSFYPVPNGYRVVEARRQ